MPLPIKLALSLIVIGLSALIAWSEIAVERGDLGGVVIAIAAVMLLGLWVFPEAAGGKPGRSTGASKT